MNQYIKRKLGFAYSLLFLVSVTYAQRVTTYTSHDGAFWQKGQTAMQNKAAAEPVIAVDGTEQGVAFKAWGTCFNELDWDALNLLDRRTQEQVMSRLFDPKGDIKFTKGRLTMNANDYSRAWYSCSEVSGDLENKYFNIEHDKQNVIGLIRSALAYNEGMTFFMSPWSPPAWMKINQDYPVLSSKYNTQSPQKDYLLYADTKSTKVDADEMKLTGDRSGVFPRRLASQNYFIQDERYLQSYAEQFCKFIDLYAEQGIKIDKVMYQNEAYSYTPYPGCAWTAEGTIRFNRDYLAPVLKKHHPEVELYLGTFNTNRKDYIEKILSDKGLLQVIKGFGVQWECRQCLPELMKLYPQLHFIGTESECGNGSMDWKAGEHTFFLISDYLGCGCDEYYIWNFLLPDNGISSWGWTQNALIQVDSKTRTVRYTPEFFALKHFSNLVSPGTHIVGYSGRDKDVHVSQDSKTPVVVFRKNEGKRRTYIVTAGNFTDTERTITVKIENKYLNMNVTAHSFNTYEVK